MCIAEGTVKTMMIDTIISNRQTNKMSPKMAANPTKSPAMMDSITVRVAPKHPRCCCTGCLSSTTTSARFCGVTSFPSISKTCLGVLAVGMAMANTK